MQVVVKHKRTSPKTLQALKDDGWMVYDVTSRSSDDIHRRFSPFFPHGGISLANGKYVSESVEGMWQGLKVFEDAGIDVRKFAIKTMRGLKRTKGKVIGHEFEGLLLDYTTARQSIFIPAYEQLLDRMEDVLQEMKTHQKIVLLDYNTHEGILDTSAPLSHAALVKRRLMI